MWIIHPDTRQTADNRRDMRQAIQDAQRPFRSFLPPKQTSCKKVDGLNAPQKPSKGLFGSL